MHEISIVKSIVDIVIESASEHKINKVSKIVLKIGELSGVNEDNIRFAFDAMKIDSIMESAELEILKVEGKGFCNKCEKEFNIDHYNKVYPICSRYVDEIISGYELLIDSFNGE